MTGLEWSHSPGISVSMNPVEPLTCSPEGTSGRYRGDNEHETSPMILFEARKQYVHSKYKHLTGIGQPNNKNFCDQEL
jgi:hypothetical protein